MPRVSDGIERRFVDLLAKIHAVRPRDRRAHRATGDEARVSKTSVAGSWGAISGTLRYFADALRQSARGDRGDEGADGARQAVRDDERAGARVRPAAQAVAARDGAPGGLLRLRARARARAVDEFPAGLDGEARRVLAEALARGEARHAAVPRNRQAIEEVREAYRRSGGATPRLGQAELAAWYATQLARRAQPARVSRGAAAVRRGRRSCRTSERARLSALPGAAEIRDRAVPMHYEVEETPDGPLGVVRLVIAGEDRARPGPRRAARARPAGALHGDARRSRIREGGLARRRSRRRSIVRTRTTKRATRRSDRHTDRAAPVRARHGTTRAVTTRRRATAAGQAGRTRQGDAPARARRRGAESARGKRPLALDAPAAPPYVPKTPGNTQGRGRTWNVAIFCARLAPQPHSRSCRARRRRRGRPSPRRRTRRRAR